MNYPTPKAVTAINNGVTRAEKESHDLRSVHSDGSVTFYFTAKDDEVAKTVHVTADGKIERRQPA